MILSDGLQQAAQVLGQSLRATDVVQAYLEAQARLETAPQAAALEERFQTLYQELLARQRAGEQLARAEVDGFHALRGQVERHPLISERDFALSQLKRYCADVAVELSTELGVDYAPLAQAT